MSPHQAQFRDEQLLRAFHYVAGELSADDSEAFELQMLDDQSLCEAVCEVTLLASAVAASGAAKGVTVGVVRDCTGRESTGRYGALAVLMTVCSCLAMAFFASGFQPSSKSSGLAVVAEPSEAELLVGAWADAFSEDIDEDSYSVDSLQDDLDVPDWLLTAVALSEGDVDSDADPNFTPARDDGDWF